MFHYNILQWLQLVMKNLLFFPLIYIVKFKICFILTFPWSTLDLIQNGLLSFVSGMDRKIWTSVTQQPNNNKDLKGHVEVNIQSSTIDNATQLSKSHKVWKVCYTWNRYHVVLSRLQNSKIIWISNITNLPNMCNIDDVFSSTYYNDTMISAAYNVR